MLGDFYFKKSRRKNKNSSLKMFTLEYIVRWLWDRDPGRKSPNQSTAAPKQNAGRRFPAKGLLLFNCPLGTDCLNSGAPGSPKNACFNSKVPKRNTKQTPLSPHVTHWKA